MDLFTCPSGKLVTLNTLFVFNDAAVSSQAVYFHLKRGASSYKFAKTPLLSQNEFSYQDIWLVMEPGDILRAVPSATGSWNVLVSASERDAP